MTSSIYKNLTVAAIALLVTTPAWAAENEADADTEDSTRIIRNLGWFMSQNVGQLNLDESEKEAFLEGFITGVNGGKGPDDAQAADQEIRQYLQERFTAEKSVENAKFVADLEKRDDVKQTPQGLYYEVIEEGNEKRATREDTVKVHYRGTLLDGTEFDSSHKRGQPAEFPVSGVVPGFGEGVQLVGEGGKVKLYIKPELGYGSRATGQIPPNSFLVFDVDLIEINPENEAE